MDYKLKEEVIAKIHNELEDTWNNGVYITPYGVDHIKGQVFYNRVETGGYSGGSCWNDEVSPYTTGESYISLHALDTALEIICPKISFIEYKQLDKMVTNSYETEYEYYGNRSEYVISYLEVGVVINFLIKKGYDLDEYIESV